MKNENFKRGPPGGGGGGGEGRQVELNIDHL